MFKTFKRKIFCYPTGFFEESNAIFHEKMPQNESEIDKKSKKLRFSNFHANCIFFEKGGLDVEHVQQGKTL